MSKHFIMTHPDNVKLLQDHFGHGGGVISGPKDLLGIPIRTSRHMAKFRSEWKRPDTRLIEHEPSDDVWLKYFGMGYYAETSEPLWLQLKEPEITWNFGLLGAIS